MDTFTDDLIQTNIPILYQGEDLRVLIPNYNEKVIIAKNKIIFWIDNLD